MTEEQVWETVYASLPFEQADKRTVLTASILFEGKEYEVRIDLGLNYPAGAAAYMWEKGNYGCDCNRRLAIAQRYPGVTDAQICDDVTNPCGETIPLTACRIEVV
jgi:hypothetical protein